MSDIRPIQYDDQSNQALQMLVESSQQQRLLEQKRIEEELRQKYELAKMINPTVLSKGLENEVTNSRIGGLMTSLIDMYKSGANPTDVVAYMNSELGGITEYNAKFKAVKDNVEAGIKAIGQDKSINASALRAAAMSKALYNPNTGRLKTLEELDDKADFVTESWNAGGSRMVNIGETDSELRKEIKDQPVSETDITVTRVDPKTNRKTTTQQRTKAANYMLWDDKSNTFDIKRGRDGFVDQSVYDQFIGNQGSARDKMFDFRAEQEIRSGRAGMHPDDVLNPNGTVKDNDAFEYVKRGMVTKYITSNSPISQLNKDVQSTIYNMNLTPTQAVSEEGKPYHPLTIIEGIIKDQGGFRSGPAKVSGMDAFDVTDAFSSYTPLQPSGFKLPYKRVFYAPNTNRFYYSTKPKGNLESQSPDQFASSILQSAPDLGFKADTKVFRDLPQKPTPTSSGVHWKK